MPSTAELVCVDPAAVAKVWPLARSMVRAAIERTALSDFNVVEAQVLAGDQLLWLTVDGTTVEAVATTHLSRHVLTLVACAGQGDWRRLMKDIEAYARAEGARTVRIYGRKGWERVLTGYVPKHVILDKELN